MYLFLSNRHIQVMREHSQLSGNKASQYEMDMIYEVIRKRSFTGHTMPSKLSGTQLAAMGFYYGELALESLNILF